MAVTKEKKGELLKELNDLFARSKSVVFSEYKGLGVFPMSDLRKRLRKANAECKVGKKSLMRLAAKENKLEGVTDEMMTGQVAATFVYGEDFAAFKALYNFSKEQDKLKILGGFIAGKPVGLEEIKKLALVPSREESLAKMLGSLMSPVSGFARVLNAYKEKLEAAAKAAAAPAPVVAATPAAATPAAPAAPVAAA